MNVTMSQPDDGVSILPLTINSECVIFSRLTLSDIPVGAGVGFQAVFGNPADQNSEDLQLFHVGMSTRVKIVESTKNGKIELVRVVSEIDPSDISSVRIDWVKSPGILDRIMIEILAKDGRSINKIVRSGLTHDPNMTTSYRIHGLDIKTDPKVSVGEIMFTDFHVPEPSSLSLLGIGLLLAGCHALRCRGGHKVFTLIGT
jgi:hypothetical protein